MPKKLTEILVVAIGTSLAVYVVRQLCSGAVFVPAMVIAAACGIFIILLLKDKYWYLIPAAMVLQLGVIPIGGRSMDVAEFIIPACFLIMIVRFILDRSQKISFGRQKAQGVFLYFWWVVLIFCMNPSGMLMFGSQSFGARFYYKILIAFLSFLVMRNVKVTERDCRNVILLVLVGMFISMVRGILALQGSIVAADRAGEDFYTWHQLLAAPALTVSILLFVRYKIEGFFSSPWRWLLYGACFGITVFSGKRMGLLSMMLVPVIQVFIDRRGWNYLLGVVAGGVVVLALLVGASHANVLPKVAQRSLAFIPGMALDREVEGQTTGKFRAYIREYAWNVVIKKHPVVGLKGYAMDYDEVASLLLSHGGGETGGAEGYAVTRSWHTTWLGMAADFGIPAAIFWGIFIVQRWRYTLQCFRLSKAGSWQYLLVGWMLIGTVIELTRSITSGHSAIEPFNAWWKFGLVVSILSALLKKGIEPKTEDCQ